MACGRNNFAARESPWVGGWDQNKELVDNTRRRCHFGSSQLAARRSPTCLLLLMAQADAGASLLAD